MTLQRLPAASISHELTLAPFLVAVPTLLLGTLARSTDLNLHWISPQYKLCLILASALLSALISYWLHQETRVSPHPAIATLAVGFGFNAALLAMLALAGDSATLAWLGMALNTWTALFAGISLVLLFWAAARRTVRSFLASGGGRAWAVGFVWLAVFSSVWLYAARSPLSNAALAQMKARVGACSLVLIGVGLLFAFHLYLRRRTSVVLSFTLSLFLFGLAVAAQMLASTWHLLWWYGHSLYFISLFLVAHGIVEGERVRSRERLIAQLGALSKELEEQSIRDSLTECFNRRYIMDALASEFRKSVRSKLPLTLLIIDADRFKDLNDSHGHPFGDGVLRELAARMRGAMRATDVLARCGGEEFYALLPQTNRVGGQEVAAKLLSAVRSRPFEYNNVTVAVTVSIGIADNLSTDVADVKSLIQAADQALYSAKHAGRDRAALLDPLVFRVPQPS